MKSSLSPPGQLALPKIKRCSDQFHLRWQEAEEGLPAVDHLIIISNSKKAAFSTLQESCQCKLGWVGVL
eukprot:1156351-Pelagomonas_calceolata.AAC.19